MSREWITRRIHGLIIRFNGGTTVWMSPTVICGLDSGPVCVCLVNTPPATWSISAPKCIWALPLPMHQTSIRFHASFSWQTDKQSAKKTQSPQRSYKLSTEFWSADRTCRQTTTFLRNSLKSRLMLLDIHGEKDSSCFVQRISPSAQHGSRELFHIDSDLTKNTRLDLFILHYWQRTTHSAMHHTASAIL